MGRRREVNSLKVLTGSRHARTNPKPGPETAMWRAPKYLGKHGKTLWKQAGPILIKAGVMSRADESAFIVLCKTYEMLVEIMEIIDREGFTIEDQRGSKKKHPACTIFSQFLSHFRVLCREFAMTPDSRERLGVSTDPLDKFLDPVEAFRRRREQREIEDLLD